MELPRVTKDEVLLGIGRLMPHTVGMKDICDKLCGNRLECGEKVKRPA
jgi:hypothetical protein